jgi:hypothetical protein
MRRRLVGKRHGPTLGRLPLRLARHQHLDPRRQPRDLRVLPRDDVRQLLHRAQKMRQRFLQFA